jgi:hypothetical protein
MRLGDLVEVTEWQRFRANCAYVIRKGFATIDNDLVSMLWTFLERRAGDDDRYPCLL